MSALTDLFTALANKIRSKTGGSDTYTPPEMVAAIDDVYDAGVAAGTTPTQAKTVTAGTSATTVNPDQGYALSSVTVNPTPSQSKSASPSTSAQTISPDAGKLLSSVEISAIQTQTKSSAPNVSTNKDVTPDSGKYLSKVTITPLSHTGTYTPAANTAANDMGQYHDKRYVNTSGMIIPTGNKSITANGTGIDVSSYATVSVNVSGGSPRWSATTLWTNSSLTSSFSSKTITLSSSMANYSYLRATFVSSTSSTSYEVNVIFPVSAFQGWYSSTTNWNGPAVGRLTNTTNSIYGFRIMRYASNTSIVIGNCWTSNGSTNNNALIPKTIEGLNMVA